MNIQYKSGKCTDEDHPQSRAMQFIDLDIVDIRVKEILLPRTVDNLAKYLVAAKRLRAWETSRMMIMRAQAFFGLPLRPNVTTHEANVQIWAHKKRNK